MEGHYRQTYQWGKKSENIGVQIGGLKVHQAFLNWNGTITARETDNFYTFSWARNYNASLKLRRT